MTRRYGEWELLDLDGDPVPAGRGTVSGIADTMRGRADEASEMHGLLKKLSDLDGWRGEAAETFADKADDVLGDLGKVEDRYLKVAEALDGWAVDVGTARTATKAALDAAVAAADTLKKHPDHPDVGDLTPEQSDDVTKHGEAKDALDAAKGKLQDAMDALDDAATRAKDAIEDAADIWDDGVWGNVKGWVRRHADLIDLICNILEMVTLVLGAALLLLVLTVGAPFLLVAIAIGASVLLVVARTSLVVADTGKATWADVGWDVVGLAATLVGLKTASTALKGLKGLAPAMSARIGSSTKASALTRLIGKNGPQFKNALNITNPRNGLAKWAAGIRTSAAAEGRAASQAVDDLVKLDPRKVQILLHQDKSLAQMRASLNALRPLADGAEVKALADIVNRLNIATGSAAIGTVTLGKSAFDSPGTISDIINSPVWSTHPAR